ncbi:fumarylacetoacetate hydrolase family protein [Halonatronum saccharophilum]|uniref:fumarylacetoacetate hydrolase family protein n=1 Tax=Halonatronum saccharophilum TaxID=150060 RepID=UPI000488A825|nr:fumarylacetoacetate hydrolase family protein [Halonatronum saccharophilum]
MKFIRFQKGEDIYYGMINGQRIKGLDGDIYSNYGLTNREYFLDEVEVLPPSDPSKIVCVGLNYKDHAKELEMELPEDPIIFLKPNTTIISGGEAIKYPIASKRVDYEAELAVIIKDDVKNLSKEEVKDYILGYTCFNDITARDLQAKDGQWSRAKSFDTFAPVGPIISTGIDPDNLKIELIKNDIVKQSSNTSQMIFSIDEIVAFISSIMTLRRGDIIATGTPPGVGELRVGDKVEVRIERVGSLVNTVVED